MSVLLTHSPFGEECIHEYPDDWNFGGPDATDPRADERWIPTTYHYFDDRLRAIHVTQVPVCDNEAIDYFSKVASWGSGFNPIWLHAERPDGTIEPLQIRYDKLTDSFEELK